MAIVVYPQPEELDALEKDRLVPLWAGRYSSAHRVCHGGAFVWKQAEILVM
jgi:hypothetical protein